MTNRSFTRGTPWILGAPLAVAGLLAGCGGGGGSDSDRAGSSSIQGVIDIESGSRVDSDYADLWWINDESWPAGSRGPVELPIPATAAGYLSASPGNYNGTDLNYPRDTADEYTVPLVEGDRYYLQCFPSGDGNVDGLRVTLSLDGTAAISDTACGSGGTVPASGNASITLATSAGGPFRYVLTIAPQGALMSFDARWPEPELRVNEAVMSGPAAVASTLSSSGLQASSVMDSMRGIGPNLWHVTRNRSLSTLSAGLSDNSDPRAETIEWIRSMRDEFGLAVEPNYLFYQSVPTEGDDFYVSSSSDGPDNWNLAQINMSSAWSRGDPSGQGVGVAVMDTGLLSTNLATYGDWHEDLAGNVVGEGGTLDFVSSTHDVDGTGGRDGNPATPLMPDSEATTSFHGTHVAGIVAAVDNESGTIGVAYRATLLPYRVLGVDPVTGQDGVGSASDLIDAIASASDRPDPDGVDVINLSLGGLPQLDALQSVIDYAYSKDILVVAAGGNSGDASAVYPAANRRVLGVGATERSRGLASYSNYGQSVDLLAPGGSLGDGIVNAYGDVDSNDNISSGYAYLAGTSMAAPHVTGVFALMKDVANVTPDQFRAQLIADKLTTEDLGLTMTYNYALHGEGLLDANKALDPATVSDFPTVVSAWPRVLELSPSGSESEVLLEVLKAPSVTSDPQVDTGGPDVPLEFVLTDGEGNEINVGDFLDGSLKIRVDPSQVPSDRPLSGNIEIPYTNETATARKLTIPVYVQASDAVSDRNAGRHYVLLLDITDFSSAKSRGVVATYDSGQYRYAFNDVDSGDYILVAGTDLDNNGFICENGEACAEYLRDGSREVISVRDGQALKLNMTTSFRRPSIAEMGLPRYGFEGYPVPDRSNVDQSINKQLK